MPQVGQGPAQDPAAAFASMMKMWSGSHPAMTLPAGSIGPLMKDAASAWAELASQAASHQRISMGAWQDAFGAFAKEFSVWGSGMSTAGEADSVESLDELLARWTATAEPILQKHSKSDAFITSQSSFMRAAMKFQKAQAAISESFCKKLGIPTRSEVDEAYRMIHELRRALRRGEHAAPQVAVPPSRTPKRKARASRGER